MVMLAALERIANCPYATAPNIAANLVADVRHFLWVAWQRELSRDVDASISLADVDGLAAPDESDAANELVDLVDCAARRGTITQRGRALILAHRVLDVPTREIADAEGRTEATVRQYRTRAEAALVSAGREVV